MQHPPPNHGMGPAPFFRPDHPLMQNFQNSMQHNMHMGNQRNKQFHHNDRQEPPPYFKNNQNHQFHNHNAKFFQNQNHYHPHNMNYHQNHGSNGIPPSGEHDEYAGLMNTREKHWLNNIQLLQLNSNQPYIDDFYYTVFCERLNKKNEILNKTQGNKQINGKGNLNNNNNGGHRDRFVVLQKLHFYKQIIIKY